MLQLTVKDVFYIVLYMFSCSHIYVIIFQGYHSKQSTNLTLVNLDSVASPLIEVVPTMYYRAITALDTAIICIALLCAILRNCIYLVK